MFLSDLGAEVIKVEDPTTGGDEARAVPPFNHPAGRDGLYYQSLNRGARSITLNLRTPEGRELLDRLVARVDAVYNNMRGDLPGKLGLDYAALSAVNPMLNYMAIWTLNREWRPQRLPEGAHQSLVPSQSFQTRDGWIVIMCMKEKFWERLVERMGLARLREDARFRTFADRLAHRDA